MIVAVTIPIFEMHTMTHINLRLWYNIWLYYTYKRRRLDSGPANKTKMLRRLNYIPASRRYIRLHAMLSLQGSPCVLHNRRACICARFMCTLHRSYKHVHIHLPTGIFRSNLHRRRSCTWKMIEGEVEGASPKTLAEQASDVTRPFLEPVPQVNWHLVFHIALN